MKKQIKIISSEFEMSFEYEVNKFLSEHADHIVDIQYQYAGSYRCNFKHSVMIVYEEW